MNIRHPLIYLAIFASILSLIGCTGDPGDTSLKYWWVGSLQYIYDDNPSAPDTIYNDQYFSTDTGDFYMEYVAFDGSGWYMNYTIEANEGEPFFVDGDPLWYEISLYSFGPSLYKWTSAYALQERDTPLPDSEPTTPSVDTTTQPIGSDANRTEILGEQTRDYPWGRISIRYGKLQM